MTFDSTAFERAWVESIQFNRAGGGSYEKAFALDAWQKSQAQFIQVLKDRIESQPHEPQSSLIAWLNKQLTETSLPVKGRTSKEPPTALELEFAATLDAMTSIEP